MLNRKEELVVHLKGFKPDKQDKTADSEYTKGGRNEDKHQQVSPPPTSV